jgi:hypothetical protein
MALQDALEDRYGVQHVGRRPVREVRARELRADQVAHAHLVPGTMPSMSSSPGAVNDCVTVVGIVSTTLTSPSTSTSTPGAPGSATDDSLLTRTWYMASPSMVSSSRDAPEPSTPVVVVTSGGRSSPFDPLGIAVAHVIRGAGYGLGARRHRERDLVHHRRLAAVGRPRG